MSFYKKYQKIAEDIINENEIIDFGGNTSETKPVIWTTYPGEPPKVLKSPTYLEVPKELFMKSSGKYLYGENLERKKIKNFHIYF